MTSNRYKDLNRQTKTENSLPTDLTLQKNVQEIFLQTEEIRYETETWINTKK